MRYGLGVLIWVNIAHGRYGWGVLIWALGSDIKPYQPSSLGIICPGLNHPWASVLLLLNHDFNVFAKDLRDDMGDDMGQVC